MDGKIVLVTGSSRGMGRSIALRLAEGAEGVAIHYRADREGAAETVQAVKSLGKRSAAFQADLNRDQGGAELVEAVENELGPITILVNNVGPILIKPWAEVSMAEWSAVIHGNLISAAACMAAVLPGMRARKWGRIINLGYSRVEQLTAFSTIVPYAAAKTGLLILTRSAARDEAPAGITVNMVSPGLIEGGVLPRQADIPIGRLGTFHDVSAAVAFLASKEADYLTGINLIVAGGWKL